MTTTESRTATFVRDIDGWRGDARLYRLSESVTTEEGHTTDHVIVSAVVAMYSGPETFIFPATKDGTPLNMLEMSGSFQGGLDHGEALAGLGFEVQP